jgi:hypothetical protein
MFGRSGRALECHSKIFLLSKPLDYQTNAHILFIKYTFQHLDSSLHYAPSVAAPMHVTTTLERSLNRAARRSDGAKREEAIGRINLPTTPKAKDSWKAVYTYFDVRTYFGGSVSAVSLD